MSGFVSKTGQKWKEWVGGTITKDENLEKCKGQVNELDQFFRLLLQSYQQIGQLYQCKLKQQQLIFCLEIGAHHKQIAMIVNKFYESQQTSNKKVGLDVQYIETEIAGFYASKVDPINSLGSHLSEWFNSVEFVKGQLKVYHEERLIYDHYKLKVDTLRHNQVSQQGQNAKFQEQMHRNENKFSNSKNNYTKVTKEIIERINKIVDNRFIMVNGSLKEFFKLNHEMHSNCDEQLKSGLNIFDKFKDPSQSIVEQLSTGLANTLDAAKSSISSKFQENTQDFQDAKLKANELSNPNNRNSINVSVKLDASKHGQMQEQNSPNKSPIPKVTVSQRIQQQQYQPNPFDDHEKKSQGVQDVWQPEQNNGGYQIQSQRQQQQLNPFEAEQVQHSSYSQRNEIFNNFDFNSLSHQNQQKQQQPYQGGYTQETQPYQSQLYGQVQMYDQMMYQQDPMQTSQVTYQQTNHAQQSDRRNIQGTQRAQNPFLD